MGPVRKTPGMISAGRSWSTNWPPSASYLGRMAIIELPSRPSGNGRLQKIPVATCARKRCGVALLHLRAEREESAGVVVVKMGQHYVAGAAEIDLQVANVGQNGVRPGAGVDQHLPAVGIEQRRESPLADAFVGQHGRKNGHLEML